MRYSSALVLGTLAVGQAAAGNIRHASFHARRNAEQAKRDDAYAGVNWEEVTYDLSNVDWSTVDYSGGKSSSATPTPTPAPSSSAKVEEAKVEPTSSSTPVYTPPASSSAAEKPKETESPVDSNDITAGLSKLIKKLGICSEGKNDDSDNGKIWVGDSGNWQVNFVNGADQDVTVFCWGDEGFTGMSLNVNQPLISVALAPGASQKVSWAGGYSSACAPVYSDTTLALFGGVYNTWFEVTFPDGGVGSGAFDISRNVCMKGHSISAVGSKCTSDMETCVFKCNADVDSCETGYDLHNCNASNGGGGGYDTVMQGTGGGCTIPSDKETIEVTFS